MVVSCPINLLDIVLTISPAAVPPKFVLQIDSTNTDINATFLWINDPDPLSDAMAYTTDAITDATVFSLDGNSYLKLQDGRYAEQDPNLALTSVFFLDAPDIATEGFSYLTCQTDTTNTWLTCQSGANVQLAWCGEYAPNGQDNGYVFSIGPDAGRCSAIQLRVVESM